MKNIAPRRVLAPGIGRSYKRRKAGRIPTIGLMAYGILDLRIRCFGVTSRAVIIEATVPPDIPPLIPCELNEFPALKYSPVGEGPRDLRVLLAR